MDANEMELLEKLAVQLGFKSAEEWSSYAESIKKQKKG